MSTFAGHLRDHFGHVLLYLRSPKAPNDCPDAMNEWRRNAERAVRGRDYKRTGATLCYRRTGVLEPRNSVGLLADRRSRRVDLVAS